MAGSRYVAVTLAAMEAFLRGKSPRFERGLAGREVVLFVRHPKCEDVRIEVFTSVGVGEEVVRPCGQDAIKVIAVYDDGYKKRFPLERESRRILRVRGQDPGDGTQGLLVRIYQAVVQSHAAANLWLKEKAEGRDCTLQPGWRPERIDGVVEAA